MADPNPTHLPVTGCGVVYPWHCDQMGHMNVMWYVGRFDEATWNLFVAAGLSAAYLRDSRRGMVAVEQQINYRREMLAGDTFSVRSHLLEVRDKSLRFRHLMLRQDGTLAAETQITGVHIDIGLRKAIRFEPDIRQLAETLCAAHADPATPREDQP